MEIFYEKNLSNNLMSEHAGRFYVLSIVKKISFILLLLVLLFVFMFHDIPVKPTILNMLTTILSALGFLLPFLALYLIVSIYLAKKAVEYDYHILGSTFRIVKVINRKKRKLLLEVPMSSISSIGKVGCDAYERLSGDKNVKKIRAFCNQTEELIYAHMPYNGEHVIVIMESDVEYMANLRKALSISVFVESGRKPIKTTTEDEE